MAAIKQTFFQECEDQLVELETGLLAIEKGDHDPETVNAVFRAVHSIKGGAGAFNLGDLVHFAHIFESAMELVRTGKLMPTVPVVKTMLRAADVLADLVREARDGKRYDPSRSAVITAELTALAPPPAVEAEPFADFDFTPVMVDLSDFADLGGPAAPTGFRIGFTPRADLYAKGNETAILLREVERLGATVVTCDTSAVPLIDALDPEGAYLSWTVELDTDRDEAAVREIFDFVEWDSTLTIEPLGAPAAHPATPPDAEDGDPPVAPPTVASSRESGTPVPEAAPTPAAGSDKATVATAQATIRVDLDRVDRLIDLVGELVINQAMLAERVTEAGLARVSAVATGLDELEQLTREIQDSVMAIRAQPVKSVFQRMPRLVREVAAQVGKSVRLVTEGEATEVDKTVIERLSDPLTHMIRNAIDHGLESPEARLASGKAEEGLVRLTALHRSGRIVIEVADDGAGINRPRVRQIAVDRGLLSPDAKLSDEEIDNLIFLPGFSTAKMVSDISGRGVGMDVVKRSIQALGGRITIASRPGQGSSFTMSLPLTLAVLDGMVVTVAGQTLVIPLTAIVETLLPRASTVHSFGGSARVIGVRDSFIPLVDVGQVLEYRHEAADPKSGIALLVEAEGGTRSALLVDAIQGQRQVVIKSLEANYGRVPGIAAATILGDGRVALILDVDAVVSGSRTDQTTPDFSFALAG
jgi:two-component system chemotaxis sensor kinase CheA